MDKRGLAFRQIVLIFYLIMAVIVIFTLIQRAKLTVGAEEKVDAYSKIIALTINSMFYSDYSVEVNFDIPKEFKIEILGDKVKVGFLDIEDEYYYIPDNNFKIDYKREGGKLILKRVKK